MNNLRRTTTTTAAALSTLGYLKKNTPDRAARRKRRSGVRADHPAATASSARLAAVHARAACLLWRLRCARRWRAHSRQARLLHGAMYHGTRLCGHGSRRRLPTAAARGWREPRPRLASRWPEGSAGAATSAGGTSAGGTSEGIASAGVESAAALARSRAGTYAALGLGLGFGLGLGIGLPDPT